jgi:hypothetical protein
MKEKVETFIKKWNAQKLLRNLRIKSETTAWITEISTSFSSLS